MRENNRLKPAIYESTRAPLTSHPLSFLPVEGCPCGADLSSAFGAPLLQGAARLASKSAAYKNTAFPHIVISSESEKSFSFAVKPRMREQRITGNAMLPTNWNYSVSCRQIHTGKKKPVAEKDPSAPLGMTIRENGLSHISFHTVAEPTSAPSWHLRPREGGRIHTIPRTKAFPAWGRWRA